MDFKKAKIIFSGGKKHLCRQFSAIPQDDKNKRSMDNGMGVGYNDAGRVNDNPGSRAVKVAIRGGVVGMTLVNSVRTVTIDFSVCWIRSIRLLSAHKQAELVV